MTAGGVSTAARRRLSGPQQRILVLSGIVAASGLALEPVLAVRALIGVYFAYIFGFLALRARAVLRTMGNVEVPPPAAGSLEQLPVFSLLCPLYRESASLPNLLSSLQALDYPPERYEILLLLEENDEETITAARALLSPRIRMIIVPEGGPRTKPNALNHGLAAARGELIGIYDAEDRPEASQLLDVAKAFAGGGAELGCVQARLNYYNRDDNIITRMFALEYALHFDWYLPGLASLGMPLPLGGTSNFVRARAVRQVGGWDPYNVTEDADLGIRLHVSGWRVGTVDSTTYEEATDGPRTWIRQRSRWIKGFLQTAFVHMRHRGSWRSSVLIHFALLAVAVSAIVSPLLWAILILSLAGPWGGADAIFSGAFGDFCLFAFILGNLSHGWFLLMAPVKRDWFHLCSAALFLPVYWTLQSVAGYRALYGFVVRPHFWAKTDHSPGEDPLREMGHA